MFNQIPRPEYPRPQFKRNDWMNLNGEWQMETDRADSGMERELFKKCDDLKEKIIVPFCRESELSGVGDLDFCEHMWYRRTFEVPSGWLSGGRIFFNVGACDYEATVWVNGEYVSYHKGGFVPFSFDITKLVKAGENTVTVKVDDYTRSQLQPLGKQTHYYGSRGCLYRRTTGIWQTVWMEHTPESYIEYTRYFADTDKKLLIIEAHTKNAEGMSVSAEASYCGKPEGKASAVSYANKAVIELPLDELHLWEVGCGRLYDLKLTLGNDEVTSYFGMRKIECRNGILYLNGKPVFQRLVLDQGFYPDGIYTPKDVSELYHDVDMSMACGFNGARLHQKIFEPLFLSYCDKKGYIVWGEHGNWGLDTKSTTVFEAFLPEWQEALKRDFNHPAIIGWCPINESRDGENQNRQFSKLLAELTKGYDPTRLYIDASGWTHGKDCEFLTDIYDIHDYEQDPEKFRAHYDVLRETGKMNSHGVLCNVSFVSEYGGIYWIMPGDRSDGWGYGNAPQTEEEFIERFKGLTDAMLDEPLIGALCYTQLTDVEQERNGLYTFDRRAKFDPEIFRTILSRKAACEKQDQ